MLQHFGRAAESSTTSYSASISSTLLFYEGQFGVQHLAQGHFGMQMGKTGDRTADLQVGGQRSTSQPQPGGSIYNDNKIGPSTEPCGKPWLTLVRIDDSSLTCTNWN